MNATQEKVRQFLRDPANAGVGGREAARRLGIAESTFRSAEKAITREAPGEIMTTATSEKTRLALDAIRLDGGTQPRAEMKASTIDDYAEAFGEGAEFPPVVVFHDGTDRWCGDGFQRIAAARKAGLSEIEAEVRQGTRRDAVLYSVGANADHGDRRTNADKRRAVETLLRDEEWGGWSDREIAKRCKVSHNFVGTVRSELTVIGLQSTHRTGGDGRTINTANIGTSGGHRGVRKPSIPLAPMNGQSRVNGHVVPDPPDVAKARAEGRIAPGVVPEVDEPGETTSVDDVREEIEERKAKTEDDLSDEEWLATLPLHSRLTGSQLKTFEEGALSYRELEAARNTYKHHADRVLKSRRRNDEFKWRVRSFLSIEGPDKWDLCPMPENGGCGGTGASPITGECPKCFGRGYRING